MQKKCLKKNGTGEGPCALSQGRALGRRRTPSVQGSLCLSRTGSLALRRLWCSSPLSLSDDWWAASGGAALRQVLRPSSLPSPATSTHQAPSTMSERGRLPRRLVDDRRGYHEVPLVDNPRGRGYPEVVVAGDRRGYSDIRVAQERRDYAESRLLDERRDYLGVRMVDPRGYPGSRGIDDRRAYPEIHEGPRMRAAPHPHPAVLEDELELQEVELRRLLAHNRSLVEERDVLNRELQAGKDEVRHLNVIIADINTQKEAYISKLVDKRRKLEAELGASQHLRDEVRQLRGEIEKLITARKELSAEAASLMEELNREQATKQQLPVLETELDGLQQELVHMRTACAIERKGNLELVEQRKAMEKNMLSMRQEIEQMRGELAKFEVRPWGTGGPYGMQMGSPEVTFTKNPYEDSYKYNIHAGVSEKGPLPPPESGPWGTYDKNRLQYR